MLHTFSPIPKSKASGFYNNLYSQVQYVMLQEVMLQEVMFYPCVRKASPLHDICHRLSFCWLAIKGRMTDQALCILMEEEKGKLTQLLA